MSLPPPPSSSFYRIRQKEQGTYNNKFIVLRTPDGKCTHSFFSGSNDDNASSPNVINRARIFYFFYSSFCRYTLFFKASIL